jgi:hypothetical protein
MAITNMIKTLVMGALFKKIAVGVLVSSVFIGLGGSHYWAYNKGKVAERTVVELRMYDALRKQAAESERIRDEDIQIMLSREGEEKRIVERIREVRVNVPTPECTDLGPEWLREYNRAISATTDSTNSDD